MSRPPRNVNFYDGLTGAHLGGVRQNGSITNANFFHMLMDVLLEANGIISIHHRETGQRMPMNTDRLSEGDYDIFCPRGGFRLTEEYFVRRVHSRSRSSRENSFRDSVRARDGKCVLTGLVNNLASEGMWTEFEAAHIFPLERRELWRQCNFDRLITINSVQNGMLVSSSVHRLFDSFLISVNPDDGYKITDFAGNNLQADGRVLDIVCRNPNNPDRVADDLLRWHFRQSVLANMKGAGEPIFEHDFPPGTDMVKDILQGPDPAQRMELELFSRFDIGGRDRFDWDRRGQEPRNKPGYPAQLCESLTLEKAT
ncbi:hypothetical protein N7516_009515 [Penicillium verrucosum]|uniref:uncharacterized protein n=1 Tax=Penicillium verrucosum TaxID=60171 RepID=UPI0025453664|nr:uncharacterized protein N7516_009515 [Penicillium verrucosum]KAJ5921812.1 hypothetical protein N7516_009515 [Penicillium verrucosum]